MQEISRSIFIAAPPARVWPVMSDVLRWKEWTASISDVRQVGNEPIGVGARFRVKQPRFLAAVWTIDLWEPPRRFRWRYAAPGMLMVGDHRIEDEGSGSRVTLAFGASGWLGELMTRLTRRTMEAYVAMEAEGLKRRCENG